MMSFQAEKVFLWTMILFWTATQTGWAGASRLSILNRCYVQMTGDKLPLGHPFRNEVINGAPPIDVCMKLLHEAQLSGAGTDSEGHLIQDSPEARQVIRRFNDFHRTWFTNDNLLSSLPLGYEISPRLESLHDASEPGLHITRILFTQGLPYSELVTGDSGLEALRSQGEVLNSSLPTGTDLTVLRQFLSSPSADNTTNDTVPLSTALVEKGDLIGIRKLSLNPNKKNTVAYSTDPVAAAANEKNPIYVHRSAGGGVLGAKSFLLLNLGFPDYSVADGGIRVARRWSRAIFESLMCRSLPTLRVEDANAYVEPTPGPSTPPFRTSASCMSCHASVDPFGATARNYSYVPVPSIALAATIKGNASQQIYEHPITQPIETGIVDHDPLFNLRPPYGRLYYRSFDGALIQQSVKGIPDLGQAIADTNDLYVCAAARYFWFFTGIKPRLEDPGDPSTFPLTSEEATVRNLVIQIGKNLKQSQNLTQMIHEILSTNLYLTGAGL